ncbi:hypothetical protein ACFOZ1_07930 [Gracilibacillus marinus]|uniref:Uncharacterized protein n=1 Tax=Gracilibacillus marinus TaxID=630535 RepID=A0ABV8VTG0_9BACI
MKNITITLKKVELERSRSVYRAFTAKIDGKDLTNTFDEDTTVIDFIENTIRQTLANAISDRENNIDITITLPDEITLSAALKTHLKDKYEVDEVFNSITFA